MRKLTVPGEANGDCVMYQSTTTSVSALLPSRHFLASSVPGCEPTNCGHAEGSQGQDALEGPDSDEDGGLHFWSVENCRAWAKWEKEGRFPESGREVSPRRRRKSKAKKERTKSIAAGAQRGDITKQNSPKASKRKEARKKNSRKKKRQRDRGRSRETDSGKGLNPPISPTHHSLPLPPRPLGGHISAARSQGQCAVWHDVLDGRF